MKKYKVMLYPRAFRDIDSIYAYIALEKLAPENAKSQTDSLLEQVGMKKASRLKMRKLSGGMLRRVGIAQAMLNDPKILVLDEPTAGLDPNERIRFRRSVNVIWYSLPYLPV